MVGGTIPTGTILDKIVADVSEELQQAKGKQSILELEGLANQWEARRLGFLLVAVTEGPMKPFVGGKRIQLIAEVKKASPSKPNLALGLDHVRQGLIYRDGGAAGISVVTEKRNFRGDLRFMAQVRRSFKGRRPAILRKDFLFDPYQLWEALAYGADAVLLIAAILEPQLLKDLSQQAHKLNLDILVEVHNEEEVQKALAADPDLIGINNRNLRDFTVDLATTERLRKEIPEKFPVVGESGIHTRDDALRLADCGVDALLIGEALVTADDPKAKMREFLV